MAKAEFASLDKVAAIVRQALSRGATVEIDGLGSFRKNGRRYSFLASDRPRVFVAYARDDTREANRIFDNLESAGFDAWMDQRKLLPGQNWPRAIHNALETSDFAVCCFSTRSLHKRGGFQAELRYALEWAQLLPLDEIFLLPVRLDECPVPREVSRQTQYVDLFPDWDAGITRLAAAIHQQQRRLRAA